MTGAIKALRDLLERATPGPWELHDSCSWRRIGTRERDGCVLYPMNSRSDNHPDLSAGRGEDVQSNPSRTKSMYFIACEESLYVKIGVSQDVRARLAELQGANAEQLLLLLHFPLQGMDEITGEGSLHEALREFRMCGEWFRPNPWLNQAMLRLRAGKSIDAVVAWLRAELEREAA
jgi:hypothetical protein